MQLVNVFNDKYMSFMKSMLESFDDAVPLRNEYARILAAYRQNPADCGIHEEFQRDITQEHISRIFNKDESVLADKSIGIFGTCEISALYKRMYDEEKSVFWENMQKLCRYSSMVRACGESLGDIECIARDFMSANMGIKPEDYHTTLMKEMLSGGEISQRIMTTLSNPKSMDNIINNVGNLLQQNNGNNELGNIMKMFRSTTQEKKQEPPAGEEYQEEEHKSTKKLMSKL